MLLNIIIIIWIYNERENNNNNNEYCVYVIDFRSGEREIDGES